MAGGREVEAPVSSGNQLNKRGSLSATHGCRVEPRPSQESEHQCVGPPAQPALERTSGCFSPQAILLWSPVHLRHRVWPPAALRQDGALSGRLRWPRLLKRFQAL